MIPSTRVRCLLCFVMVIGIGMQSVYSGLTLEQCLDAYTREETLEEEDSWYCSSCQTHRRGVMKIDLWKMPDVLVSHESLRQMKKHIHIADSNDLLCFSAMCIFGIMALITAPYQGTRRSV